ncbi:MAG: PepSY domain-containing protein [Actinomycetes bacterium]
MRARLMVGGAVLIALAASGCGGGGTTSGEAGSPSGSASSPGEGAQTSGSASSEGGSAASPSGSVSASEQVSQAVDALATAAGAVPNGRPFDMEHDTENGQQVWEIKVAADGNQHTVYVSLDGKQVVGKRQDQKPDDDVQKLQSVKVEAADALRTVADKEPGATLDELEIDTNHDDKVVWEVELRRADGSEVEFDVDAVSGQILS